MSSLDKYLLIFDASNPSESDNVGAFIRGASGEIVTSSLVSGKQALDANIVNSVTVQATDFDIRDLNSAQDSVTAIQGTSPWVVGDGGGSLTVDAVDLDIRNLSAAQDNIAISDGTDTLAVNADGSINVNATVTDAANYAEDAAHASGDIGKFMLAVRNDADASLVSADGDYAPLQVNANGRLKVDAELDVDFDYVYAEDSAHSSGDLGAYMLAVRQDTLASSTSTDGDYASLKVDSLGRLWTAASVSGDVADDAADSGNPIKVGSRALSGALAPVSANNDRADMVSDLYRRLYINDSPNIASASTLVSVTNVETALPTIALAGRRRAIIQNQSGSQIFVGPTGVTTANGIKVTAGSSLSLEVGPNVALFAISSTASGKDVIVFELA
jgi:hypothetical protein